MDNSLRASRASVPTKKLSYVKGKKEGDVA